MARQSETTLDGMVALITGAAGGLGQEFARQLAAQGCRLVLSDLPGRLPEAHASPAVLGHVAADLAEPEGPDALLRGCAGLAPHVDLLLNNAGLAGYGRLDDVPPDRMERLMRVNLLAPMRLTALLLPGMRARRRGHIVNVASVAGIVGVSGLAPYCTSKFGLRGFGAALQAELRRDGVAVTNIYPFFTRTPILDSEVYGDGPRAALPERLVERPEAVVAESIRGIRARRPHVYPGPTAKAIALVERVAPWALRLVG